MNERYPSAESALPRSRTGHTEAGRRRPGDGGLDVRNPQGQVVHALPPGINEAPKRPLPGKRLHQLNLGLSQVNEGDGRVFAGDRGPAPLDEAEGGERNRRLGVEITDDDGHMLEAGDRAHTTADG